MKKREILAAMSNGDDLALKHWNGEIVRVRVCGANHLPGHWWIEGADGKYIDGSCHSTSLILTWAEYEQTDMHKRLRRERKYRDHVAAQGYVLTERASVQEETGGAWVTVKVWVPASEVGNLHD